MRSVCLDESGQRLHPGGPTQKRTLSGTNCVSMPCADTSAGNAAASSSDSDAGSFTTAELRERGCQQTVGVQAGKIWYRPT